MKFFKNILNKLPEYQSLLNSVSKSGSLTAVSGTPGVAKANIIHSLCVNLKRRAFVVVKNQTVADTLINDLLSMGSKVANYPARDFNFNNLDILSHEYEHKRLCTLDQILNSDFDIIVTTIEAALQYTIPKPVLSNSKIIIKPGLSIKINELEKKLVLLGYKRFSQVEGIGQFSLKGGILDLFSPNMANPVRLEFFGDEIDTISYFDKYSQLRIEPTQNITILPCNEVLLINKKLLINKITNIKTKLKGSASLKQKKILENELELIENESQLHNLDKFISLIYETPATLYSYLNSNDLIVEFELTDIKAQSDTIQKQMQEDIKINLNNGTLCKGITNFAQDIIFHQKTIKQNTSIYFSTYTRGNYSLPLDNLINFKFRKISPWNGDLRLLKEDLKHSLDNKYKCVVLCGTKKSAIKICEDLNEDNINSTFTDDLNDINDSGIFIMPGNLSSGFEYPQIKFIIIPHSLFSKISIKKAKKYKTQNKINSFSDLNNGDYVVHSLHGIGIFRGIRQIKNDNIIKDYIKISYANSDTLYVPVTQLDMVTKYIGSKDEIKIKLNRLGSSEWQKTKKRAKSSAKDIAKDLIKIYSERMSKKGHAFPADSDWQQDFEARFEFEETNSQLECAKEIKEDMQKQEPMDRILCGDVGVGKTEVAFRAAFKCVTDSMQCVMLAPTTILAYQHYQTALSRFEGFPIKIQLLSRFKSAKEQKDILNKLKSGQIDFIIGTHRLLQKDVIFRNLGLLIIDEEQRFGVTHKEKLKKIASNVDILTLTATPIPRTLNMALSGIRDMSSLDEIPKDRYPIQTYVLEYDINIIVQAINKELRRGGQVYYLHNRVDSIKYTMAKLQKAIPNAKIGIAHGKMNEDELYNIWQMLLEHTIDILVCTTIIESGIDIPNVNTIIIENADNLGLSQLHQLRGRVGRSNRKSYAYFTFNKGKVLTEVSQKRLEAIYEFTEFGAGFKISLKDLEIRGSGNLLGGQQHGHMETVGYNMYMKLLSDAIKEEKGEKPLEDEIECLIDLKLNSHIPENYIDNLSIRLDIYRQIADIKDELDVSNIAHELKDRFGTIPEEVISLIYISYIRRIAIDYNIYEIKQQYNNIIMYLNKVDIQRLSNIIKESKEKILLNTSNKPYLSVPIDKNSNVINKLKGIFNININI